MNPPVAETVAVKVVFSPALISPDFGEADIKKSGTTPVPDRLTVWAPLLALLLTVMVAVLSPTAEGVKVTLTGQVLPGAMLMQLLLWVKSLPGGIVVLVMSIFKVPGLLKVTVRGVLLVATPWLAKVRLAGDATR